MADSSETRHSRPIARTTASSHFFSFYGRSFNSRTDMNGCPKLRSVQLPPDVVLWVFADSVGRRRRARRLPDRYLVRALQGLAAYRHPLRPVTDGLALRRRSRGNRHFGYDQRIITLMAHRTDQSEQAPLFGSENQTHNVALPF
jgi:hypothetical protein